VPGPAAPSLSVTGAEASATADGIVLGIHMANDGNAFAKGVGVIRVASTDTDYSFRIDTFVSHTAIVYPMRWTKAVVPGVHHIQVDLTYDGNHRTTWSGTVDIAGDLQHQLESSLAQVRPHAGSSMPFWLVLAGLAGIALVGGAAYLRRRGRRPPVVKYRHA
jgi:LPXTG-motif cell wall-anchored protein